MSLFIKIKEDLKTAMKTGDNNAKVALRVLLAKLQTIGKDSDDAVISTVKTLVKQTEEEIASNKGQIKMDDGTIRQVPIVQDNEKIAELQKELIVLNRFLPEFLSLEKIKEILQLPENLFQIKESKNDGAATGLAIKLLKSYGPVEGNTVKLAVNSIRS